ncbi:glycosyl transferase family 4 [Luteibacter rhizovicinus]|uniref:Glycosyl transferase family 4 n=1 Tax=Luteibacter rhizovicinus TaxID=242606 RepID=A0A4R3Z1A9_9GAMM|nr:hypothetical protein [Luteibacter rhizovicinus]TCV97634.1 glycosyl transferase family 4 [Luteibacter rhizovicinus]
MSMSLSGLNGASLSDIVRKFLSMDGVEGAVSVPYIDSKGIATVSVGINLSIKRFAASYLQLIGITKANRVLALEKIFSGTFTSKNDLIQKIKQANGGASYLSGLSKNLFLKDVFPRARLIHFCEFYYHTNGQDFSFDPEFPNTVDDVLRLRVRNFLHLMAMEQADAGIAPTHWQRSRFPESYQSKWDVRHAR